MWRGGRYARVIDLLPDRGGSEQARRQPEVGPPEQGQAPDMWRPLPFGCGPGRGQFPKSPFNRPIRASFPGWCGESCERQTPIFSPMNRGSARGFWRSDELNVKDPAGSHLRGCRRVRQLGRKEEIKPDLIKPLHCKVLFCVMIPLEIGRYIAVFRPQLASPLAKPVTAAIGWLSRPPFHSATQWRKLGCRPRQT